MFSSHSPAVAITAGGYAVTGLSAYLAYPTTVTSNVLNTFPPIDYLMQAARGVVGVLEIASYPVNHFPARAAIRDFVRGVCGAELGGTAFSTAETIVFFGATLALALVVEDLGAVFTLVGGTCGSVIILGLPGVLLINLAVRNHVASRRQGGTDPAAAPLLPGREEEDEVLLKLMYHAWWSKLFWAGMALTLACVALFSWTVASAIN